LLKELNLRVEPFTTVVIKGKSGSGKTTLSRICARLDDPVRGKVEIGKVNVRDYAIDALRKVVALVNPDQGLLNRTIGENILFGSRPNDTGVKQRAETIFGDFSQVFVGKTLDSAVGNNGTKLSTGQKMLVKLMNLLVVGDSPIMIFDEPTGGLDAQTKLLTLKMIDTLKNTRKHTILIITHDEDCAKIADKTYELANSVLVAA
jgi:subfamily B ATP-binding cassette protein MsbA